MQISIDNMVLIAESAAKTGSAIGKALEDGKVTAKDLPLIIPFVQGLAVLVNVDFEKLKEEVADLDGAERAKMVEVFSKHFDLVADDLEGKIESAVNILIQLGSLVEGFIRVGKAAK